METSIINMVLLIVWINVIKKWQYNIQKQAQVLNHGEDYK
jgi:hypothetical protein